MTVLKGMNDKFSSWVIHLLFGITIGVLATVLITRSWDNKVVRNAKYESWRKLNLILDQVEKNYVDTIDKQKMTDAAVVAALAELDPHSVYMPPEDLEESETSLAGNFDGIGIQFNVPNDTAIVLEVIPGGPAEKVGMMQGDRLLKVDGKDIAGVGFPQDSMVRRIKGPAGTKVEVTVKRGRETIPFEITRGKIPVHSVDAAFMADDTTGYIRLSKFARTTYDEFDEAGKKLLAEGMKRLVLDLRDNNGGYLDQALMLSNAFLSKGSLIVYTEGLHSPREDFKADGRGRLKDVGVTVVINEGSASSSEILAGAIQDNDRGVIVGRRSFGKGLVQKPVYFNDKSGIRITIARFHSPSGRCIQKPYDNYEYDIYNRYVDGEVFSADSVKLDTTDIYKTPSGRVVYGGGGIMPDIFVPVDTTRATPFYAKCNRKATQMRFASDMFDRYAPSLQAISDYGSMDKFFSSVSIESKFRSFASSRDGITATDAEWKETLPYLLPQLKALVARYSKLGENAFYKYYLEVDETLRKAIATPSEVAALR